MMTCSSLIEYRFFFGLHDFNFPCNTVANLRGDLKAITTRSGISYDGPPITPPFSPLPKVVERELEVTKDTVQPSTKNIQPLVVQTQAPIDEPVVAPKPKSLIHYPSRANKQKLREKVDNLASKFVEIFRELHFELSFADALLHMPIFDSILRITEACLTNDSIPPRIDDADFDPEGDLLLLEKLLNDDPSSPLPPKELHFEEIKTIKSSIDDPPKLELKDLPSHL
ncbi:hypothetical protein Tco_0443363 [Tanacetum coccineum]